MKGPKVFVPRPKRTRWQRFVYAVRYWDAGRNMAEVEGCWHLHQIVETERELYGEVRDLYALDHVEGPQHEHEAKMEDWKRRCAEAREAGRPEPPEPWNFGGCRLHWHEVVYR